MDSTFSKELSETLAAPVGDLIAAVGEGVAEAQLAMDSATIGMFQEIYQTGAAQNLAFGDVLRAIGYQPTWYRIPKLDAELAISLYVRGQTARGSTSRAGSSVKLYGAPIDALYANKYDYDLAATSRLRFSVVAVPAAPGASELRIVPDVLGLPYPLARQQLEAAGLQVEVLSGAPGDTQIVSETLPRPGEVMVPGMTIRLTCQAPGA